MLRVRRDFELLQNSQARKLQTAAFVLLRDLFRREQLAMGLGRRGLFLLLLD
jgi:hypothetical protein